MFLILYDWVHRYLLSWIFGLSSLIYLIYLSYVLRCHFRVQTLSALILPGTTSFEVWISLQIICSFLSSLISIRGRHPVCLYFFFWVDCVVWISQRTLILRWCFSCLLSRMHFRCTRLSSFPLSLRSLRRLSRSYCCVCDTWPYFPHLCYKK